MPATPGFAVLIVEDDTSEALRLAEMLRSRGHLPRVASTGDEAVDVFREDPVPLVLVGAASELDGPGVCRRIRELPGGATCVVLGTGRPGETSEALEALIAAGADDVLPEAGQGRLWQARMAGAERLAQEFTERERLEVRVAEMSREVEALSATDGRVFFSVDAQSGRLLRVSSGAAKLLGASPETLGSDPSLVRELIYPAGLEAPEERLRSVEAGQPIEHERQYEWPDGSRVVLRYALTPHHDADGSLGRVDGIITDVTGADESSVDVGTRNEELEALLAVSELALHAESFGSASRILEEVARHTGFPVVTIEEFDSKRELMTVVAAHGVQAEIEDGRQSTRITESLPYTAVQELRSIAAVDPSPTEHSTLYFRDQKLRTVVAAPLQVGKAVLGALVLSDTEPRTLDERFLKWVEGLASSVATFTERVRSAADLSERETNYRRLAEQLQHANAELEGFAYSVSHDLRAPLRTMTGFAHALVEDHSAALSPAAKDYAERIISSGRKAEELISDLLNYSRLSFQSLELQPIELSEVMKTVTEQLKADIDERGARLDVDTDLPQVMAAQTILVQVLSNLVSNAIKFVPTERTPEIRISSEKRDDMIRVWVEDNGIGVPPDQVERIFRVFERLSNDQRIPGTGIGLAIVRRGMERIGGAAGVELRDDGSAFWIEMQRRRKRDWRPFRRRS